MNLERLLEEVAAPTPAPGGGACCGWAAALAAALVEMAAGVAEAQADVGQEEGTGIDERLGGLRAVRPRATQLRLQATELADRDRASYAPVLAAERTGNPAEVERALARAADVPFALAGVGAEVAELARQVLVAGRPSLRGDAMTALELARAACRAATGLVQINLAGAPGDPRLAEVQSLLRRIEAD
jgi:methenyltetrahydrofolate cyclohydrolase